MPTTADIPARRFRRAAAIGAVLSLAFFLWTIWMLVHFNAGTASIKFGTKTMLNIASVALPGPVLLSFLAWNARVTFCRIVGWVSLPLVLLLTGMIATYASIELRPPFAPGDYDAAVKETETQFSSVVNNTAINDEFRQIRAAFKSHPAGKDEYAALATRAAAVSEQFQTNNKELHRYQQLMEAPFDKRAVSTLRRDEYLRLVLTRVDMPGFLRQDDDVVNVVRFFEQRLRLLADKWDHWQWTGPDTLKFDDPALDKAYDDLIEKGKAAP